MAEWGLSIELGGMMDPGNWVGISIGGLMLGRIWLNRRNLEESFLFPTSFRITQCHHIQKKSFIIGLGLLWACASLSAVEVGFEADVAPRPTGNIYGAITISGPGSTPSILQGENQNYNFFEDFAY